MKYCWQLILLIAFTSLLQAQPVKRIYLANDDHTDYMWSANEEKYDSAFVHMLDYYLDQIDVTKNLSSDFQTRFNCDGSFWVSAYQRLRSPIQFERLMTAIRSGHISSPLNSLASTYGAQPTESVLRGVYYAGSLERKYNLRFRLAVAMENQTLPLGLSSLWAGAGAKYSWRGICACASKLSKKNYAARKHQLYNYQGFDERSVIMKWYKLRGSNAAIGGYPEARGEFHPKDTLKAIGVAVDDMDLLCDTILANSDYPYNAAAAFGYGWDDLATYNAPLFTKAATMKTTAARKVRLSNEEDFFEDIEQHYAGKLPAERLSYERRRQFALQQFRLRIRYTLERSGLPHSFFMR